jgi:hypothetical protein
MQRITFLLFVCCQVASATTRTGVSSAVGRDYYIAFPKSAWGNQSTGVLINSPTAQVISFSNIDTTQSNSVWHVKRGNSTIWYGGSFAVQRVSEVVQPHAAVRVQAVDPISVVAQFGVNGISGTYTALPTSGWGTEYFVVAPPEGRNSGFMYYPTVFSVPMITIMAMTENTRVTITPTAQTAQGRSPGVPFTVVMNAGDVYNVTTAGDPEATTRVENPCDADFTGTHVTADHPIGVIAAQTHASWPCGDNECGDYCVEFLPPVSAWDTEYAVVPSIASLVDRPIDALRIVFAQDGTDLIVDDGVSQTSLGTFASGQFLDYGQPPASGLVFHASKPFLVAQFTRKSAACVEGKPGTTEWTLGMTIIPGVHQWAEFTPFSTAIGSRSYANILFRYNQRNLLHLSGKPLIDSTIQAHRIPGGYAYVSLEASAGTYYEITGDSGATAGGNIFGMGTLRFGANDGPLPGVQDAEVTKSFAHPIGINATQLRTTDFTAPSVNVTESCGGWKVIANDSLDAGWGTGISDIYLVNNNASEAYNAECSPSPQIVPGTMTVSAFVSIPDVTQDARALLRVRDCAGNQFDTVLTSARILVEIDEPEIILPRVPPGGVVRGQRVLHNSDSRAIPILGTRFFHGATSNWRLVTAPDSAPSVKLPVVLQRGDSAVFEFAYTSPVVDSFIRSDDTLVISSCGDVAYVLMSATNNLGRPITPRLYDFHSLVIDTLSASGDAVLSRSTWITNTGGDSLRVTGVSIVNDMASSEEGFPESDYSIVQFPSGDPRYRWPLPSPANPWMICDGDTAFVAVSAHPHHRGPRPVHIDFATDVQGGWRRTDIRCTGVVPSLVASDVEYGTHAIGTTVDSFFVVRNMSASDVRVRGLFAAHGAWDTSCFVFNPYYDSVAAALVSFDTSASANNTLRGNGKDTLRIPYRFLARRVGAMRTRIDIRNNSVAVPAALLEGTGSGPTPFVRGACYPAGVAIGALLPETLRVINRGNDMLTIAGAEVNGERASEFSLVEMRNVRTGQSALSPPWAIMLLPNDTALAILAWNPTNVTVPAPTFHVLGMDRFGRRAGDSAVSFYNWDRFPYDTAAPVFRDCSLDDVEVPAAPVEDALASHYPHPFTTQSNITITLAQAGHVSLSLRSLLGAELSRPLDAYRAAGTYSIPLSARNLSPGVYSLELRTPSGVVVKRVIVTR